MTTRRHDLLKDAKGNPDSAYEVDGTLTNRVVFDYLAYPWYTGGFRHEVPLALAEIIREA